VDGESNDVLLLKKDQSHSKKDDGSTKKIMFIHIWLVHVFLLFHESALVVQIEMNFKYRKIAIKNLL